MAIIALILAGLFVGTYYELILTRRKLAEAEFDLAEADTAPWVRNR
jgi:hypothetical protein